MSAPNVETALTLSVSQIIAGELRCDYCDRSAVVMISTGADPEPTPHCAEHGCVMLAGLERAFAMMYPLEPAS